MLSTTLRHGGFRGKVPTKEKDPSPGGGSTAAWTSTLSGVSEFHEVYEFLVRAARIPPGNKTAFFHFSSGTPLDAMQEAMKDQELWTRLRHLKEQGRGSTAS